MTRTVLRTLAKVFSIVLLLVGIGALWGGHYAHDYVTNQLAQEKITMPAGQQLTNDEMKKYLTKYEGQPLRTGPQAEAFANHYLWEHMMKSSGGKVFEEVSGEYIAMTPAQKASPEGQKLGALRQNLFMGDSLRSMLLTAYAFWLVGTIAQVAGWACLALGVLLALLGWLVLRGRGRGDADHEVVRDTGAATGAHRA